MFRKSIVDRFKGLDVYRKLPSDFVQPTSYGAFLSIISSIVMILLFLNEFLSFRQIKTTTEMYVDVNRGGNKIKINLDIEFISLPCQLVAIDIQDVIGAITQNFEINANKTRISRDGKEISTEKYAPPKEDDEMNSQIDYEFLKKQIADNEGCRVKGNFWVNKVPGNFHISTYSYGFIIQRLAGDGLLNFNMNHIIHHLSYGEDKDIKTVENIFQKGILNPLDNIQKTTNRERTIYEYYTKIVPSTYHDLNDNKYFIYQFTSNTNENPTYNQFPAVYFRHEFTPITVEYTQYKDKFLNFFIQICAILGGVYTVTGIIDALVHKSIFILLKKAERGKLG